MASSGLTRKWAASPFLPRGPKSETPIVDHRPPTTEHQRLPDGFTLVEVLLAIVILTTGLILVFQGFGVGVRAASLAEKETTACLLAQRVIADLEMQETLTAGTDQGEFEEDYPGYRYETEITESAEVSGLYEVRIMVFWVQGDQEREITVTKLMTQVY